jgi:two-component system, OmpR family, sensor kinase
MKLYFRIWLAIVATIAVFALVSGLLWRNHSEHIHAQFKEQIREQGREFPRQLEVRNSQGEIVGFAKPPQRRSEAELDTQLQGEPIQRKRRFEITLKSGEQLEIALPNRLGSGMRPNPPWYFSPWGFALMLGLMALAVALGAYPIVRRLTKRLETLQTGVERWGSGHLSERVSVEGKDEVAFLATKFNHAAAQVETLVTSHKALLANASHELRSPLARIRMGLEVMDAAEIKRNIAELDALIEEILLASRLDAPNADIGTPESFDLLGLAAEECARMGAVLDVAADSHGQFEMQGHPKLIRRLLRNLLENAAKYNDASKGEVSLSLTQSTAGAGKSEITITVRDHGMGVVADEAMRIFEPFYRAKNASERDGGVGLGLSLVQTIAKRHGGSAVCVPTSGTGGYFKVTLLASFHEGGHSVL